MIRFYLILSIVFYFIGDTISIAQEDGALMNWNGEFEKIVQSQQKNPARLLVHMDQLKKLVSQYEINQPNKDSTYFKLINRLGAWYFKSGNFDRGVNLLKSGVAFCKKNTASYIDPSFAAILYYNLGYFSELMDMNEAFHLYMDSCIHVSQKFPNRFKDGVKAYEKLSLHHLDKGDHHRSLDYVEKGLLFAGNREGNGHVALLYLQKAQVLLHDGLVGEAEETLEKVFDILSRADNREEFLPLVYPVQAYLLEKKGEFEKAISYYRKAYERNEQHFNYRDSYKALNNMGIVFDLELGQPENALECYQKCIKLLESLEDEEGLATIYNNMGYLHLEQDNLPQAMKHFQYGLESIRMGVSDTLWSSNPSRNAFKLSINDQITFSLIFNKAECLLKLYKKHKDQEHLKSALETFTLADLSINLMRWNQRHDESKLYWRKESKEMYELAIETCYLLQDPESALYFFEKSRAVLLNDKLSELGAQQFLSKEDAEKEQALKLEMVSLERKLNGTPSSSPVFQKLSNQKFHAREEHEKFINSLESKYPNYYRYKYDTTVVTLEDMTNKVLEHNQAYLGYFVGEEYVYALTIDRDTAEIHKMPIGELPAKAEELLSLTSSQGKLNQNYSRYLTLAHDFYLSFFQHLGLNQERILISPDDYFIPFELLIKDPDHPGSFLLEDHAFSYTYSAGFLLKNNKMNRAQTASLLGMAPVEYQPHLQMTSLSGSDRSLNRLNEHFSRSRLFTGQHATKKQFLSQLSQNEIVHLYSHAVADVEGTEPTLYFADSLMLLSELQGLGYLPTQLILLSACNTAVGKNVPGEGVFSLARGFAAAGIPSSITSLWPIDNKSTFRLSEIFYEILAEGKPTDLALQEAKLLYLKENPGTNQLPYFWAAKVLVGKSFTFNLKNNNWVWQTVFVVAVLLVGLIVYQSKRSKIISANA